MKKSFKEVMNKKVSELEKEMHTVKDEIVKIAMEAGSNPQKDTNSISKKRRRLAVLMTAMNQQKEAEAFKNTK